ncbi:MAG: DUF1638 domain-containing protein [Bryobacteraceae bacterium]|nr:DUF1638 domain-containing protein [Bryobacteraceae bacterium]
MNLKLICCEVLYREMCWLVARSPNQVDVEFLPKGLHDLGGAKMREGIQQRIDATAPDRYEAVLLGYALCGNGVIGLEARRTPLVIPRAHDCIALLMGGRETYQKYFDAHPGVYFRSTGWLERGENLEQLSLDETRRRTGAGYTLEGLVAQYGEDNGRYLWEQLGAYKKAYRQLTYIETGVEPNRSFEIRAREEAARRGWTFDLVRGNLHLLGRLVDGDWDAETFLKVPVGYRTVARYDDSILDVEPL